MQAAASALQLSGSELVQAGARPWASYFSSVHGPGLAFKSALIYGSSSIIKHPKRGEILPRALSLERHSKTC